MADPHAGIRLDARGSGIFLPGGPRWDFLANSTQAESTLLIGSPNQRFDEKAQARLVEAFSTPEWFGIDIDLTQAYADTEAVHRRILHRRGDYILLYDTVALKKETDVSWLLQVPPEAKIVEEGREVQMTAPAGRLSARLLAPPLALTDHQPVSKHHNLKPGWQRTLAATQHGERLSFLALLLPEPLAKGTGKAIKAEVLEEANLHGAILRGDGWHDRVLFSSEAAPQPLEAGGCKTTATVLACRMDETDAPQSWFMLGASEVNLAPWTLRPAKPAAL